MGCSRGNMLIWLVVGMIITVSRVEAASGICSMDGFCTWVLDEETGVMQIIGDIMSSGFSPVAMEFLFYLPAQFQYRSLVNTVVINWGIYSIPSNAFTGFTELTTVILPMPNFYNMPMFDFKSIGDNAFKDCSKLQTVTVSGAMSQHSLLPKSITSMGNGVFDGCTSLNCLKEDNVHYLGSYDGNPGGEKPYFAVIGADKTITSCEIKEGTLFIATGAFKGCTQLESVGLSSTVTTIGDNAFEGCTSLSGFTIPDTVTNIGVNAFKDTALTFTMDGSSEDGYVQYLKSGDNDHFALITVKDKEKLISYAISDETTVIANEAFSGCSSMRTLTFGNKVSTVGTNAFKGCTALESVTLSNYATMLAFSTAFPSGRIDVKIRDVSSIGDKEDSYWNGNSKGAFEGCKSIKSVSFEGNTPSWIGIRTFYGSSLESVVFPETVTSIGTGAFSLCAKLSAVSIPASASISNSAFYGCSSLKTLTIEEGVSSIGSAAFKGCNSLESVSIPKTVGSIGDEAFASCFNLKSVTIGNNVASIGMYAFEHCGKLDSVAIPESVKTIEHGAFEFCSALKTISYAGKSDPGKNAENVFLGCNQLEKVEVPIDYADSLFCGSNTGDLKMQYSAAVLNSKPTKCFVALLSFLLSCVILFP